MVSIKQALNRMNNGHYRVLEAFSRGDKVDMTGSSDAAFIGIRKCARTLTQWGAIENGTLTEFGRELFAAAKLRYQRFQPIAA